MIEITVRLHSILRNREGQIVDELNVELPSGAMVQDVLLELEIRPDLDVLFSLNGKMAGSQSKLNEGDTLAIIPALSGGSKGEL